VSLVGSHLAPSILSVPANLGYLTQQVRNSNQIKDILPAKASKSQRLWTRIAASTGKI